MRHSRLLEAFLPLELLTYTPPMHKTIAGYLLWTIFGTSLLAQTPTQTPALQQQKERWNKAYASSDVKFNRQPDAFLLKSVQGKTPGTALEIGMGQGRNTIAMARLGWDVTGIDISDEGIRQAVAKAKKQNVNIHAIVTSAEDFDYGSGRYDLIYATFEHQIVSRNADKIVQALKPGGMIVIEDFRLTCPKRSVGRSGMPSTS